MGAASAWNWLVRRLTGLTVHDVGTTFRAYEGDIVRQLRLLGEHHRFIPVLAKNLGAKITEVEIQNIERPSGASNYGLSRTLNVLRSMRPGSRNTVTITAPGTRTGQALVVISD